MTGYAFVNKDNITNKLLKMINSTMLAMFYLKTAGMDPNLPISDQDNVGWETKEQNKTNAPVIPLLI